MEWTKIPTDLITKRYSDYEISSIVKFQLVWAMNEEQPDEKTCLRYMTKRQYETAMTYLHSISAIVGDEVSSVLKKREVEKIRYNKIKNLEKILPADSKQTADSLPNQRRIDKIREEKENILKEKEYKYSGNIIRLNEKDYYTWKEKYPNIDLDFELECIDNWFMKSENEKKRKDWFWSTASMLARKNKEIVTKKEQKEKERRVFNGRS